jgi:hypothetical protein
VFLGGGNGEGLEILEWGSSLLMMMMMVIMVVIRMIRMMVWVVLMEVVLEMLECG